MWCKQCNIETNADICPVCGGTTVEDLPVEVYWCDSCKIPIINTIIQADKGCCPVCGGKTEYLSADLRPVFPEERLLVELLLEKEPNSLVNESLWASNNRYYINGKSIAMPNSKYECANINSIIEKLHSFSAANSYDGFNKYIQLFTLANRSRLEYLKDEAFQFIKKAASKFPAENIVVSFSGGKDSTVSADLAVKALSDPSIVHIYGDTTLEFPSTTEYAERFRKNHPNAIFQIAKNDEQDFYDVCEDIGPPARMMRWCCSMFKTGPITRVINSLYDSQQILTFYGIRKAESVSRSKYNRIEDSADAVKIKQQTVASPIFFWKDIDIWLYILSEKIDFNDAYRLGYDRVGCWCCPNNNQRAQFLSRIYMPEKSTKWRDFLISFAAKIGKPDPEVYVDEGKWKARQGGNGVDYAKKSAVSFEPCVLEENAFNYELQRPISDQLYELFKPFGYLNFDMGNKRLGEVYVTRRNGNPVLKLQGRIGSTTLKVTIIDSNIDGAKNLKTAEDKIKCQITKYQMCMACRACESICKHNAIVIKEDKEGNLDYRILDNKCVRCAECVNHYTAGCYMRKVLAIKRN